MPLDIKDDDSHVLAKRLARSTGEPLTKAVKRAIQATVEVRVRDASSVAITDDTLTADLSDGRTISVPLTWYPRLVHATVEERCNWRLVGRGLGPSLGARSCKCFLSQDLACLQM